MNLNAHPLGGQPVSPVQWTWQRQLEEWHDLVCRSSSKPSRKRVHALRSLTLRLQIMLEHLLLEQDPESAAVHAFKRWRNEARKLRRVLGPIRDADIYLARLDNLRSTHGSFETGETHLSPSYLSEFDKLEKCLRRQRCKGIDRLMALREARAKRLNRRCKEIEAVLATQESSTGISTSRTVLQMFAELVEYLPLLDSSNLHAFRKRIRRTLYVAEMSAPSDAKIEKLAEVLRKMHSVSGECHDWQALALKASRVLSDYDKEDGVVPALETLAELALNRAIGLFRRSTAHFLKNTGETLHAHARNPVGSEPCRQTRDKQPSSKIACQTGCQNCSPVHGHTSSR